MTRLRLQTYRKCPPLSLSCCLQRCWSALRPLTSIRSGYGTGEDVLSPYRKLKRKTSCTDTQVHIQVSASMCELKEFPAYLQFRRLLSCMFHRILMVSPKINFVIHLNIYFLYSMWFVFEWFILWRIECCMNDQYTIYALVRKYKKQKRSVCIHFNAFAKFYSSLKRMVGCGKICVADFCMKGCFICYSLKKEMKKTKQ